MASYAELKDVQARLGRLWQAFSEDSNPSYADVEEMLETLSGTVDALVSASGYPAPVADENAREAFRDLVASGVAIQAAEGMFPGGSARDAAREYLADATVTYTAGLDALKAGTFPALLLLASGSSAAAGASDFWSRHEDYGRQLLGDGFTRNPALAPYAFRDMRL